MTTVSVVMPAYNEANGIPEFLAEITNAFTGLDTRIFVVDDQSSDDTAQVVEDWSAAHGGVVTLIRSTPQRRARADHSQGPASRPGGPIRRSWSRRRGTASSTVRICAGWPISP